MHRSPYCTPDGRSVLFASSSKNEQNSLYRFDRFTKQETVSVALDHRLVQVTDAIDSSRVVIEEEDGIIEIVDIEKNRKIRTFSGFHPAMSPNHTLIAWTIPASGPSSHVLLSNIDGTSVADLGEGNRPVFQADNKALFFLRYKPQSLDIVQSDLKSKRQDVQTTKLDDLFENPYHLTISPDGTATVLSACCGRYGSAVYWRLLSDHTWKYVDSNLGGRGGWSEAGLLIYETDGRDLRPLDPSRSVWVGDIKSFDSRTGLTRTVVRGISQNKDPRWCPAAR